MIDMVQHSAWPPPHRPRSSCRPTYILTPSVVASRRYVFPMARAAKRWYIRFLETRMRGRSEVVAWSLLYSCVAAAVDATARAVSVYSLVDGWSTIWALGRISSFVTQSSLRLVEVGRRCSSGSSGSVRGILGKMRWFTHSACPAIFILSILRTRISFSIHRQCSRPKERCWIDGLAAARGGEAHMPPARADGSAGSVRPCGLQSRLEVDDRVCHRGEQFLSISMLAACSASPCGKIGRWIGQMPTTLKR